jgi:ABC-2 type transport system permease protein
VEMFKPFIRLFSFFWKEVNEILRQPRLVLSLILGPFIVLLLFGMTYSGGIPQFRVALVVPPNSIPADQLDKLKNAISTNFTLASVGENEASAIEKLRHDEVNIIEILPIDIEENITQGKRSIVKFVYLEVNPFQESWIQYLGSSQVNEINRLLLVQAIKSLQTKGNILSKLPPEVVISPLAPKYQNLHGATLSFVNFYGPSVLALIIQHIAVTLGALSLVHEQAQGTLEIFHVAPVSSFSIITGKYLGYTLFLSILAGILIGLLVFLGTPFLGSVIQFIALMLLLIFASLGIGFMISSVANTDSTAMQLAMLTLLFSIFFSGFFLPIQNFNPTMRIFTNLLPLTHGLAGFQNIMLKGTEPNLSTWVYLGIIALTTFIAVQIFFRRQMKNLYT